ncbi:TnsD family Tn7-like transposition protein [Vibrio nereis]|uniref:TnsD family Tn7-like transposition protein n=1 Tax=Vibrio nereis TaxID=693 RepID=UPI0024945AD4|nr:TnsD family Tn7-like transposition protein [Vibrio nereis]
MIMQFPVPYKDEMLSSILARFNSRQGIDADKKALEILFGSRNIVPSMLFQGHIESLLTNVGHIWKISPEEVIRKHSLLYAFKPFMNESRYGEQVRDLLHGYKNQTLTRLGVNASNLIWSKNFLYCPACLKSDLDNLGETYWRRHFQLPGVECCPLHECKLIDSGLSVQPPQRHSLVSPDVRTLKPSKTLGIVDTSYKNVALSKQIQQLLEHEHLHHSPTQWTAYYQALTHSLNLRIRGGTDHDLIKSTVRSYWGNKWLNQKGLRLDIENNWLKDIFRKHRRSFSYLHHLIVMGALLGESMSITEECRKVDSFPDVAPPKKNYSTSEYEVNKFSYRSIWLELIKNFNSLKEIRATREGACVYSWLYRFDRDWQTEHSLAHLHKKPKKGRIDWQRRDRELVRLLIQAEKDSYLDLGLPRKSRLWFGKRIGASSLIPDKVSKMPLCRSFLDRYQETVEEYQLRRLLAILVDKIKHGERLPHVYELERSAGLSKKRIRKPAAEVIRVDIPKIASYLQLSGRELVSYFYKSNRFH